MVEASQIISSDNAVGDQLGQIGHQADDISREQARDQLRKGLNQMNICLSEADIERSIDHAELLIKWSSVCNLSAIRDMKGIVTKHLLDSFSISNHVQGNRVIDIGSGAGFPGIPLALANPHRQFVLLDSSRKKVEFLRHSTAQLNLKNIEVLWSRVQNIAKSRKFDTILTRALGSLSAIVEIGLPFLAQDGCILAMKGRYPDLELVELKTTCSVSVHGICVPGINSKRHLVILKQS